ncbi:Lsr2 family protein [uncultured Pseudokineococcus sp.]|uniref:histone-like nucleoid-structuring protein Lsr2 n=1 Tax=uncultured Pseudokineococcus sp. TaxID=1642928 RepID=UPI002603DD93|nr:Lsr2 family protein [uncultured Pseudokineococcus sp.]
MAQKTQTILTDDIDGGDATQTVTFSFQGTSYEIDLNDEHAASIEESFAEWIANARKVTGRGAAGAAPARSSGGRASSGPKRTDLDAVRAWARENGHEVSDRGRVSNKVLEAYDAAH